MPPTFKIDTTNILGIAGTSAATMGVLKALDLDSEESLILIGVGAILIQNLIVVP